MTEESQKKDMSEEEGMKDAAARGVERGGRWETKNERQGTWIFPSFEWARRWGLICRKIDWTGVTFALVLLTSIDTSLRRLSRGATTRTSTEASRDFRKIAREPLLRRSCDRNAVESAFDDSPFFENIYF